MSVAFVPVRLFHIHIPVRDLMHAIIYEPNEAIPVFRSVYFIQQRSRLLLCRNKRIYPVYSQDVYSDPTVS